MHQLIPGQGRWLNQVVSGLFAYHAAPTNSAALIVSASPSPDSFIRSHGLRPFLAAEQVSKRRRWSFALSNLHGATEVVAKRSGPARVGVQRAWR